MGHEQMEDGEPFCLLAQAVSEQHDQWWQDYWQRSDAHQQSGYDSVKDVGQIVTAERQLFGSAVPPIAKSARGTCGNQSHGSQAGPFGVPHVAPWDEIRGQRSRGLRVPTSPASDQLAQAQSRHARIPGHRSSRSLSAKVSGERAKQPHSGPLPPDRNLNTAIHTGQEQRPKELSHYNQNDAARQLWPSFPWCFYARCRERGSGSLAIATMVA